MEISLMMILQDYRYDAQSRKVQLCNIQEQRYGKAHNRYDQYNYESSPVESITWLCNNK